MNTNCVVDWDFKGKNRHSYYDKRSGKIINVLDRKKKKVMTLLQVAGNLLPGKRPSDIYRREEAPYDDIESTKTDVVYYYGEHQEPWTRLVEDEETDASAGGAAGDQWNRHNDYVKPTDAIYSSAIDALVHEIDFDSVSGSVLLSTVPNLTLVNRPNLA